MINYFVVYSSHEHIGPLGSFLVYLNEHSSLHPEDHVAHRDRKQIESFNVELGNQCGRVLELVDNPVLEAGVERRKSSTLFPPTRNYFFVAII